MTNRHQINANRLTFFEHFAALRRTIYAMLGVFLVAVATIHTYREPIIKFLLAPLGPDQPPLQFLSPLDPLYFILTLVFTLGLLVSAPFLVVIAWSFVRPALPVRHWWIPALLGSSVLILGLLGAAYTYWLVAPFLLEFLSTLAVPGTSTAFTARGYLSFLLNTTTILVAIFQIPVVIYLLVSSTLLSLDTIRNNRSYMYVGAVVVVAIITPTTDVVSLALVTVPCIAAIELGIFITRVLLRTP